MGPQELDIPGILARTEVAPGVVVSTAALGAPDEFGRLYETQVLGREGVDPFVGHGERCSDEGEARTNHEAWVAMVRGAVGSAAGVR
jgi:hypothetical protein